MSKVRLWVRKLITQKDNSTVDKGVDYRWTDYHYLTYLFVLRVPIVERRIQTCTDIIQREPPMIGVHVTSLLSKDGP